MDFKDVGLDQWYRALTVLCAGAVVGVTAIGNDPQLRKALLFLCIGGMLVGLGEWISHPLQERVGHNFKISGYPRRWYISGTTLTGVGILLAARGVWLLW